MLLPAAVLAVTLAACGERNVCSEDGEIEAFVMSQRFVTNALRAPATARFPYITASGVSSTHRGGCLFRVRAYVDAQNGFGANIRTAYQADVEYTSGGRWRLVDLTM
ncbi:MAG: hypothetical protein KIS96_11425 [Bauldia sp.]|nr:hypothetical protein [Bauldia sp.]